MKLNRLIAHCMLASVVGVSVLSSASEGDPVAAGQQFNSKWNMANGVHDLTTDNKSHSVQWSGSAGPTTVAQKLMCMFCHTAHATEDSVDRTWMWSHDVPTAYSAYSSVTLISVPRTTTASQSAKCLGCHDGTVAVSTGSYAMPSVGSELTVGNVQLTAGGKLTSDSGLVVGLSSTHPVSFTYDATLASRHQLRVPAGNGSVDGYGIVPLFGAGGDQMECATCHDPHLKSGIMRRQFPTGATQDGGTGNFCLYCHF